MVRGRCGATEYWLLVTAYPGLTRGEDALALVDGAHEGNVVDEARRLAGGRLRVRVRVRVRVRTLP